MPLSVASRLFAVVLLIIAAAGGAGAEIKK
jgi:hypothetical protein